MIQNLVIKTFETKCLKFICNKPQDRQMCKYIATSLWITQPAKLTYNSLGNMILILFFHKILYITWSSITSLLKNIKYISINIVFNVHFDLKYVVTEFSPTITVSCYTFQSTPKAWTHTWTACILWLCFTITPDEI